MNCIETRPRRILPGLQALFLCMTAIAGCAAGGAHPALQADQAGAEAPGRIVKAGESASIEYLCRLRSGEVAAATNTPDANSRLSRLYAQPTATGPVQIHQTNAQPPAIHEQRSVEGEIEHQLASRIAGMKEGETRSMEILAADAPPQEAHKYIARLRRVRIRPKEWKMPKGDYEFRAGRSPEVGQEFTYDPDFPGKVTTVTDSEVTVRLSAVPGAVIETPFGPGTVREDGPNYLLPMEAQAGALVRVDAMSGRISHVDDETITIDFGNAFGGETLFCNVTVDKVAAPTIASGE